MKRWSARRATLNRRATITRAWTASSRISRIHPAVAQGFGHRSMDSARVASESQGFNPCRILSASLRFISTCGKTSGM
eukprot:6346153-Prymnesium_polylepis.3